MVSLLAIHLVLSLFPYALASITLLQPLSYQFPPVARVDHPYTWTFSPTTFNSSTSAISYIAQEVPSWLSFSASDRTFTGSPTSTDIGSYIVQVTASDGETSLTDHVALTVSERSGLLNVTSPISTQLTSPDSAITSAFPYPSTSPYYPGVRVPPGWSFSLGFQTYTYTASSRVYYSAAQADGSPLPSWLEFNNQTVTFDGVTPLVESGTLFNIVLSGSDVFGYSDAQQEFSIVIAAHDLQSVVSPTINLTLGETYPSISIINNLVHAESLAVDNKSIHRDDIANFTIDSSSFSWLTFIANNNSLSGIVPATQGNASLPMSITDKYGDVLQTQLNMVFYPSAFRSTQFTPSIAHSGVPFSLALSDNLVSGVSTANTNITVAFEPKDAASWLAFVPGNLTLSGTLPNGVAYDTVTITVSAQDLSTNAISTSSMILSLMNNSTTSATPHSHPRPTEGRKGLSRGTSIAIGIIGSLVGASILLFGVIILRRKRQASQIRRRDVEDNENDESEGGREKWYEAAETPALEYVEKMGDPATAHMLVGLSSTSDDTVINSVPHLLTKSATSKGSSTRSGNAKRKFLLNPFGKKVIRVPPKISNPIIMPSLTNAAFQAQLAAAVDSAGIVNRHSTIYTQSELDRSDITYLDNTEERSDGGFTATGTATITEDRSRTPSYISGSEADRSLAGSKASYRTDVTISTEIDVRTTITDDSRFQFDGGGGQSSRASWESEPPFVWTNADTSPNDGARSLTPSDLLHEATAASISTSGVSSSTSSNNNARRKDPNAPTQRADFRAASASASRAPTPQGQSLADLSYEGISIDNIHFPTDSDIAHTEASFPSDRDDAVIRTASRIDARRTLDSPATASLASSHTERGTTPSPIMTTHSRLVSFGKQKKVEVEDPTSTSIDKGRSVSHTAVLGTTRTTTTGGSGVGLGIGMSGSSSKPEEALPSPPRAITRPRAPIPPSRSPSPPSSLPSLPALPTLPSTTSVSLRTPATARRGQDKRPAPIAEPQRILLGVCEPFHFYPPLSISPSSSGSTNASSAYAYAYPGGRTPGAEYVAFVEKQQRSTAVNKAIELGELPKWLHFEDGELWGVPTEEDRGEVDVRIVERRGGVEKVVGRFALEVVGR